MTIVTGSTISYGVAAAGGNREDIENEIWELDPTDFYALTNFEKVSGSAVYHEWLLDTVVGVTANRQLEGDSEAYVSIVSPTRVGNYHQISRKSFLVSRTQEKIAKAGRKSEGARQMVKQMRELKNDMEYALVRNQPSSEGGAATARSSAGMESWIATNEVLSTTTAGATTAGFAAGVVAAPTDGTTTGALTIGTLKTALQGAWSSGGHASVILTSSTQKEVIDSLTSIATRNVELSRTQQAVIHGASNLIVTSYGTHKVVLHRHVRTSVVLCVDPEYWSISFLDRPTVQQMAKTADGNKYMMITEFCLVSRNQAASAKVVALS